MSKWDEYHQRTVAHPPRPLLLSALRHIQAAPEPCTLQAVELGCGSGHDTRELLRQGWEVYAIDQSSAAINLLQASVSDGESVRLGTRAQSFEETVYLPRASLVYASLSLPFCRAETFPVLWQAILSSLAVRGWFAADFFGTNDDWVKAGQVEGYPVNGHSREELQRLLAGFSVLQWDERQEHAPSSLNQSKFWHVHSIVAQRNT
jgi:tellurite methyltransferase